MNIAGKPVVGFDLSQIAHGGGVGRYTDELSQQLALSSQIQIKFFYSSLRKGYAGKLANVKQFHLPPTLLEPLFNSIRMIKIEQFIGQVDIFHSSDWFQPPSNALNITTYHDVIPIKYPEWSVPKIVGVHKKRLKLVEAEVDQIIAVSETTKKDLLEVSHIPAEKITVIYEAAGQQYKPQDSSAIQQFKQKYHLPEEFVLAIGGKGNRRNLDRVKAAAQGYKLVITGEDIKGLSDQEMPLLYAAAKVLLYPSLYEGFGLPILEAMQTGTPVITGNLSAMPEVGGDAAIYVDPTNLSDITAQLNKVMSDSDLRKDLIKRGLAQASKFSWEKTAQKTIELYLKMSQNGQISK